MKKNAIGPIVACLAACLVMVALCAGCSSDKGGIYLQDKGSVNSSGEEKSLSFFGFKADPMNLTATDEAMAGFMAENPGVKITYEGIKGTDYWDAFDKRDEQGVLDDVFMMHHDHVISMVEEGKLADLSDIPGVENFTDEAKSQFTEPDGSVYFLPTSISTYNLYINYDMLEAHGQEIPTDWAQFQQVCDYFVSQGITPIIANNRNSLSTLILGKGLYDLYQEDDAAVIDAIEVFNENPDAFAETLAPGVEQVADMVSRGWFDSEVALETEQTSDDLDLFVKDENPFMVTGGWASTRVMAMDPPFTYGVYPYPILDDGSVLTIQVDTCISVNANSPNLEEAKKFVEYLIRPDVMWAFCDSQASYTPLKDDRLPSEKTLVPSTEYLQNGRIAFRAEYRLTLPMEAALKACSTTLLKGGTVEEAQKVLAGEIAK